MYLGKELIFSRADHSKVVVLEGEVYFALILFLSSFIFVCKT